MINPTSHFGAGPYKFVKYENKTVYMEANENYYKGAPKTKYLQWRETSDADKIAGVEQVQSTFPIHPEANLHLIRSRALTETMNSAVIRSSLTQQTTLDTDTSVLTQTQSMLVESQDLTLPRT